MSTNNQAEDADDALFKALGHRTRRRLLDALKAGPRTTGRRRRVRWPSALNSASSASSAWLLVDML